MMMTYFYRLDWNQFGDTSGQALVDNVSKMKELETLRYVDNVPYTSSLKQHETSRYSYTGNKYISAKLSSYVSENNVFPVQFNNITSKVLLNSRKPMASRSTWQRECLSTIHFMEQRSVITP